MQRYPLFAVGILVPGVALAGPGPLIGAGIWAMGAALLFVAMHQLDGTPDRRAALIRCAAALGFAVALLGTSPLFTVPSSGISPHLQQVLATQVVVFGLLLLALAVASLGKAEAVITPA